MITIMQVTNYINLRARGTWELTAPSQSTGHHNGGTVEWVKYTLVSLKTAFKLDGQDVKKSFYRIH